MRRVGERTDMAEFQVATPSGLTLHLTHYPGPKESGRAVLLLHGASTSSEIFQHPHGGLTRHLRGFADVWTLDWRGGLRVVGEYVEKAGQSLLTHQECQLFTLDKVASEDIPSALAVIAEKQPGARVSLLGFCVGSGAVARAVELGSTDAFDVDRALLMTLGLFYQTPWDGWLKAADFLLERALQPNSSKRAVSPHRVDQWPTELESTYKLWPHAWLGVASAQPAQEVLRRTAFMFGNTLGPQPLAEAFDDALLSRQYGAMHIGLYTHVGQMVRRGFVAPYDAPELAGCGGLQIPALRSAGFKNKQVTLLTGAQNRIWHRDAVDRMYEWLMRHSAPKYRPTKHVLPDFGHLDLLWSSAAQAQVYGLIQKAVCG